MPMLNVSKEALEDYWKQVVGEVRSYSCKDTVIRQWSQSLSDIKSLKGDLDISVMEWQRVLQKAKSWKAPRPDKVRPHWCKILPGLSNTLRRLCQDFLNTKVPVLKWMICGRTALIPKMGCDESPGKYHPIACLNSSYMLFTAAVINKLLAHVMEFDLLPLEQCAIKRGHGMIRRTSGRPSGSREYPCSWREPFCGLD